jgi:transposase
MRGEMMSSPFNEIPPIPRETARSARAIFGHRNFYVRVGEHLESILQDVQAEHFLPAGAILPQITFFQFLDGLTDAQAIDAVRSRLDWKFALHLPVYPPTFRESALCEFRQKVLKDPRCQCEFQKLIDRFIPLAQTLPNRFRALTSLELVSYTCAVNRLVWAQEAIRQTLEVLAVRFPEWLRKTTLPQWYGRYNQTTLGFEAGNWPDQQESSMDEVTADIDHLLNEIHRSRMPEIGALQEVKVLGLFWKQQIKKLLNDKHETLYPKDCASCAHNPGWKEV